MKPIRFSIFAGIVWACGSLLLIIISLAEGSQTSWVELDFRPLIGTVLIASEALGLGSHFEGIISYAENGMPLTPLNIIISPLLGFADGFISGFLIALIYNFIRGKRTGLGFSVLHFALAAGIVLGLCSGILGIVSLWYGLNLETFDFSVRPLFLAFTAGPDIDIYGLLSAAKRSYMILPHDYAGALAWTLWGFLDGFIGGAIGAFVYSKVRGV